MRQGTREKTQARCDSSSECEKGTQNAATSEPKRQCETHWSEALMDGSLPVRPATASPSVPTLRRLCLAPNAMRQARCGRAPCRRLLTTLVVVVAPGAAADNQASRSSVEAAAGRLTCVAGVWLAEAVAPCHRRCHSQIPARSQCLSRLCRR